MGRVSNYDRIDLKISQGHAPRIPKNTVTNLHQTNVWLYIDLSLYDLITLTATRGFSA